MPGQDGSQHPLPPVILRRRLAEALRNLRTRLGLTVRAAADRAKVSASALIRLETGQSVMTRRDFAAVVELYQSLLPGLLSDEERDELIGWRDQIAAVKGWWSRFNIKNAPDSLVEYVGLEVNARALCVFDFGIPGLFQTEDYAAAIIGQGGHDSSVVRSYVELRLFRQQQFIDSGLKVDAVIDESAVHRRVQSGAVMREQMRRLAELADMDTVDIRILPFENGLLPAAVGGSFTVLAFEDIPPAVYLESPHAGVHDSDGDVVGRYEELFGMLRDAAYSRHKTAKTFAEAGSSHS